MRLRGFQSLGLYIFMQEGGNLGIESGAKIAERCAIAFYYRILWGTGITVPVCEGLVGNGMAICKSFLFGRGGVRSQAGEQGSEGHVGR